MIEEGDRVMVCLSGGKDSYGLLDVLMKLQARAPVRFELVAVNLDQKQPGFPAEVLPNYLQQLGIEHHIETQDTYSIVKAKIPEGKTTCSLCSRLRRGILYSVARRLKCNKIALGHHRDDMLQTFFLNMFFGGKLKGMPPKLTSDNGEFIVIRPLAYVDERDLIAWAAHRAFPIIPCNLCGSQENLQRQVVGDMLRDWQKKHPGRIENMFAALQNVVPSHLMDATLHDFKHLQATGVPCAPYAVIETAEQLAAVSPDLLPGILKTARMGYDGKGQVRVKTPAELAAAWDSVGKVPCVLEKMLPLQLECSVIVARGAGGARSARRWRRRPASPT